RQTRDLSGLLLQQAGRTSLALLPLCRKEAFPCQGASPARAAGTLPVLPVRRAVVPGRLLLRPGPGALLLVLRPATLRADPLSGRDPFRIFSARSSLPL